MIGHVTIWRVLTILLCVLVAFAALGFWALFFSLRPPNTTEPAVLAGDGSVLDYCDLPPLDGSGLLAADIPKANTPGCSYEHFPLPILARCTEPLPPDASDMRGLWQATSGRLGHVERIEQCGRRVVVTTSGIIHDAGPNSTAGETTNDTEGRVAFRIGDRAFCPRSSASMVWHEGVLDFRAFGWGPVVVRRYLDGDVLVWEYVDGSVTRMARICQLPEAHRVPPPR